MKFAFIIITTLKEMDVQRKNVCVHSALWRFEPNTAEWIDKYDRRVKEKKINNKNLKKKWKKRRRYEHELESVCLCVTMKFRKFIEPLFFC